MSKDNELIPSNKSERFLRKKLTFGNVTFYFSIAIAKTEYQNRKIGFFVEKQVKKSDGVNEHISIKTKGLFIFKQINRYRIGLYNRNQVKVK